MGAAGGSNKLRQSAETDSRWRQTDTVRSDSVQSQQINTYRAYAADAHQYSCDQGDDMKIMVVGGGGREHAIIRSLKKNPEITEIYALPGNGGMTGDAVTVDIGAKDIGAQVRFAQENGIDYAVIAQDDPLALGAVDALREVGIPAFGPDAKAAEIESSKVFSKNLMKKYGIPTAQYEIFEDAGEALEYVKTCRIPIVVKADGLALGKGVTVAMTRAEAENAVRFAMEDKVFGASGERIVIEEYLEGPEVSVLSFTDGKTLVPMVSSMDHKRAKDGDLGPNTGGMGTVAPNPYYTADIAQECMDRIFMPTVAAMNAEGRPFKGCLYFGLMLTKDGPKVIEYNCRFGDPETQVVLPLLKSDLFTIMKATTEGTLDRTEVVFSDGAACCVVMASEGYPVAYEKGYEISMDDDVRELVYVAGARYDDGVLRTGGGRVLGVTAVAQDLRSAVAGAYENVKKVSFGNAYFRKDIGARALKALEG